MRLKFSIMMLMVLVSAGCATVRNSGPLSPDQTTVAFFDDLQRVDHQSAYALLGKGISQRISYDQFDQFMKTLREQWGMIETEEIGTYPFHRRAGEDEFIPLKANLKEVRRYTFTVTYQSATMNFDLTLAPEGGAYKIVWFSVWGSSIYINPKVQQKIQELFSGTNKEENAVQ